MSDLISREEAIKCLDGNILITGRSEAEAVREYFEIVIKRLENLPTIDLVRCGECKHFNEETHGCNRNPSVNAWWETDYCSYGERK